MKKLSVVILTLVSLIFMSGPVFAMRLDPNSGNVSPGSTQSIAVLAAPPGDSTAIQVRFNVNGGTVTGWTDSSEGSILSIGACNANNDKFTAGTVCVDLAITQGFFTDGQLLGYFTIQFDNAASQSTVVTSADNGYLLQTGGLELQVGNTLGTYIIDSKTTPTATIPVTGIEDYPVLAIAGFAVIAVGGAVYFLRMRSQTAEKY